MLVLSHLRATWLLLLQVETRGRRWSCPVFPQHPGTTSSSEASPLVKHQGRSVPNLTYSACVLLWEETKAPRGNPGEHRKNVQTPRQEDPTSRHSSPGSLSCEAALLIILPTMHSCHPPGVLSFLQCCPLLVRSRHSGNICRWRYPGY